MLFWSYVVIYSCFLCIHSCSFLNNELIHQSVLLFVPLLCILSLHAVPLIIMYESAQAVTMALATFTNVPTVFRHHDVANSPTNSMQCSRS